MSVCGTTPPPGDPVILAVGSEEVRRSEFDRHVASLEERGGALEPEVRRAVLDAFLEERLLVLEARRRGLVRAGAPGEQERQAVDALLMREVMARLRVSPEEEAARYAEGASECEEPETVRLRQILVPTENEARDVRRRLQKEPTGFETLARTRSRAPEASTGGVMGTFARGQLPEELEDAAFGLAPGEVGPVVATVLGYHVLRVDARSPALRLSLEECRPRLRKSLETTQRERAQREYLRGLWARAKVNHEVASRRPDRP